MQSRANGRQVNDEYQSDDSDLPEINEIFRRALQKARLLQIQQNTALLQIQ